MAQTELEFFETAITRSGALNASGFARKLGVHVGMPTEWKKGRSYPSDKTMLKIALLCDLDPVEALALLNLWRCDESARSTYARLLDVAKSTALKSFPYMGALILASWANLATPLKTHAFSETSRVSIPCEASQFHHYAIIM